MSAVEAACKDLERLIGVLKTALALFERMPPPKKDKDLDDIICKANDQRHRIANAIADLVHTCYRYDEDESASGSEEE